ncbi:MAG: DUF2089 domain-containing protein [Fimbriimonadales bacterium]
MNDERLHPLPYQDPVSGGELYVSELRCDESGIAIQGRFEVPIYSRLEPEMRRFLEVFLRCRGNLSLVERELGLSYPTVRSRLDGLLVALGFAPVAEPATVGNGSAKRRKEILDQLERGEITAEQAKQRVREA